MVLAPNVFQGTRSEIEERLKQVEDTDRLTLIVEPPRNSSAKPQTFAEILLPASEGFAESGMTDDELAEFLEAEVKAYRQENRTRP